MQRLVVALSIAILAACSGKVELLSGISEAEGNEVLVTLLDAGIEARKTTTKEGTNISVETDQIALALNTLKSVGLPRTHFDGMGQIFRKEGLISSPLEERARYLYALSQELSSTLTQIDGVLVARVHIVLPESAKIGEKPLPSSAAVFIKHRRDYSLDALQPQIKLLVTHSIPGLEEDQVTVVLIPSHPIK